jgi:hypothetical protein
MSPWTASEGDRRYADSGQIIEIHDTAKGVAVAGTTCRSDGRDHADLIETEGNDVGSDLDWLARRLVKRLAPAARAALVQELLQGSAR